MGVRAGERWGCGASIAESVLGLLTRASRSFTARAPLRLQGPYVLPDLRLFQPQVGAPRSLLSPRDVRPGLIPDAGGARAASYTCSVTPPTRTLWFPPSATRRPSSPGYVSPAAIQTCGCSPGLPLPAWLGVAITDEKPTIISSSPPWRGAPERGGKPSLTHVTPPLPRCEA